MTKVNIELMDGIHTQAKIISVIKKIPLGKYLEECVKKGMKADITILDDVKSQVGESG